MFLLSLRKKITEQNTLGKITAIKKAICFIILLEMGRKKKAQYDGQRWGSFSLLSYLWGNDQLYLAYSKAKETILHSYQSADTYSWLYLLLLTYFLKWVSQKSGGIHLCIRL